VASRAWSEKECELHQPREKKAKKAYRSFMISAAGEEKSYSSVKKVWPMCDAPEKKKVMKKEVIEQQLR